jgi:hypothetical protein
VTVKVIVLLQGLQPFFQFLAALFGFLQIALTLGGLGRLRIQGLAGFDDEGLGAYSQYFIFFVT